MHIILVIIIIAQLLLGLFVWKQHKKDPVSISFAGITFTIVIWSVSILVIWHSKSADLALWNKIVYIAPCTVPSIFLYFVCVFPDRLKIPGIKQLFLIFAPSVLLLILNASDLIVYDRTSPTDFKYNWGFFAVFLPYFFTYFAFSLIKLFKKYKTSTGIHKIQIKYVFCGTACAIIIASICSVILPIFNIRITMYLGPYLTGSVLIISIAYAIIKYQLMDIKVVITQITVFIGVYGAILGIPFLVGYYHSWILATILMCILATSGPLVYQYLQRKAMDLIMIKQIKLASIGGMTSGIVHQIANRITQFNFAAAEQKQILNRLADQYPKYKEIQGNIEVLRGINNIIEDNIRIILEMTYGMLNFTRAQVCPAANMPGRFSLREIVDLVVSPIKIKHEIKEGLPLEISMQGDDIIYGIKAQIIEIIMNLLDNAYEAIIEKRENLSTAQEKDSYVPKIRITLNKRNNNSIIEISDNGIGMKEDNKEKIFSPFFTTKYNSKKSGTGIGIYVVKRMVEENHRGKISFKTKYMEGTTFTIVLPGEKAVSSPD